LPTLTLVLSDALLTHPFLNAFSTILAYGLDALHRIKDLVFLDLHL
jgi:hypothetical protein